MDEDEVALLAELRAISSKSASSRFQHEEENDDGNGTLPSLNNGNKAGSDHSKDKSTIIESTSPLKTKFKGELALEQENGIDGETDFSVKPSVTSSQQRSKTPNKTSSLPPWKRRKEKSQLSNAAVDVVIAAHTATTSIADPSDSAAAAPSTSGAGSVSMNGGGLKSELPSTFTGDRGGSAEDAELLALLRGVSAKSTSRGRFAGNDDGDTNGNSNNSSNSVGESAMDDEPEQAQMKAASPARESKVATPPWKKKKKEVLSKQSDSSLPPWKRGKAKSQSMDIDADVVVAAPPAPAPSPASAPVASTSALVSDPSDVAVGTPNTSGAGSVSMNGGGLKSELPSTFTGDRGGSAEDAELLALLRGVSAKSTSRGRFAGNDDGDTNGNSNNSSDGVGESAMDDEPEQAQMKAASPARESKVATPPWKKKKKEVLSKQSDSSLPPWKRGKAKSQSMDIDADVVVAAPPAPAPVASTSALVSDSSGVAVGTPNTSGAGSVSMNGGGLKSELPSTFTGDRGGSAEDAELLALLRGVSAKSTSRGRFAGNDDGDTNGNSNNSSDGVGESAMDDEPEQAQMKAASPARESKVATPPWKKKKKEVLSKQSDSSLPPWKRGKAKSQSMDIDADVVVAAPPAPAPSPASAPVASTSALVSDPSDVAVGTPNTSGAGSVSMNGGGLKSELPSTFTGDRGGSAEDAELLALLRGVSAKSTSRGRFAGNDDGDTNGNSNNSSDGVGESAMDDEPEQAQMKAASPARESKVATPPWKKKKKEVLSKQGDSSLPPWKRGKAKSQSMDIDADVVVAAPPAPAPVASTSALVSDSSGVAAATPNTSGAGSVSMNGGGLKSELPSTFTGDRGGSAEDAELLALLRGVSAKSTSRGRFAGNDDGDTNGNSNNSSDGVGESAMDDEPEQAQMKAASPARESKVATPPWKKKKKEVLSKQSDSSLPPWKRGKAKSQSMDIDADVVVAAPPAPAPSPASAPVASTSALVSDPSDVAVGTPNTSGAGSVSMNGGGLKSELPSTFTGDRGGSAEDAELLALLRGVSAKSTSRGRFAGNDDGDTNGNSNNSSDGVGESAMDDEPEQAQMKAASPARESKVATPPWKKKKKEVLSKQSDSSLPPWKRGKAKSQSMDIDADVVVAAPPSPAPSPSPAPVASTSALVSDSSGVAVGTPNTSGAGSVSMNGGGLKSELPSTFTGDRGGSAEDPELLALLRGISSKKDTAVVDKEGTPGNKTREKNSVSERTLDSIRSPDTAANVTARSSQVSGMVQEANTFSSTSPSTVPPMFNTEKEECLVTRETLPTAVTDKNWKVRKQSYEMLTSLLSESVANQEPNGTFDAEFILNGLDEIVSSMMRDSNASALDSALQFGIMYADYCKGAGSAELAAEMTTSLLKGSAFSSSRPSTTKLVTPLTLKLMEVGTEGVASVHSVTDVLLDKGLISRKPKVVLATVNLIFEAATTFGAGCLPLASISTNAPKMLSHSNAKVRDSGMKIIAEICRALGSRDPLRDVIGKLKKAQLDQLDALLEAQPGPSSVKVKLRSRIGSSADDSPDDALAAFQAGAEELEAKRFASRSAVNILQELPKTNYSTKILLPKWSEKVAALDLIIQCGGQKPYKLSQPSPSINYGPLIVEMKKLLSHTHFAVCSKAMAVLSMLATGVGEKLYPHLKPLLPTLLALSKDKKLTKAVASCLDTFFGNILSFDHLLEKNDSVPSQLDEKKQKNALVRSSSLEFLRRCVEARELAGPRSNLTAQSARGLATLCCEKVSDTDASVRKSSLGVLNVLSTIDDTEVVVAVDAVIDMLKSKNPRAYKSLRGKGAGGSANIGKIPRSAKKNSASSAIQSSSTKKTAVKAGSVRKGAKSFEAKSADHNSLVKNDIEDSTGYCPTLEDALSDISSLGVPDWDAPEDDGGILAGLKSTKWLARQHSIKALCTFCTTENLASRGGNIPSSSILLAVKNHTKSFKESNFNIMKAIMELFVALCHVHEDLKHPLDSWICRDGATASLEKISDRKLAGTSSTLLTALCTVSKPERILGYVARGSENIKSPLVHEGLLKWYNQALGDFGAAVIFSSEILPWLLKESESTNIKVRNAALAVVGELHCQLGPGFQAALLSSCSSTLKSQLESTCKKFSFDPTSQQIQRSRKCIVNSVGESSGNGDDVATPVTFDIPKTDLIANLPSDCIEKMGCKDGKTAWKIRKESMDKIASELESCSGLIVTATLKPLVDLLRALKERLSDSQSNLKPLAARVIGSILASVDKTSQAKLGKVAYSPLVHAAMNDNRKPMRESALESLKVGTSLHVLEGTGPNELALEPLIAGLVNELAESEYKSGGIPEVLKFVEELARFLPDLDSVSSARGQTLGERLASVLVGCLTSSKAETRASAESVLKACLEKGAISSNNVRKGTERLLPAQQRSVQPVVDRLESSASATQSPAREKEHFPSKLPTKTTGPEKVRRIGGSTRSKQVVARSKAGPSASGTGKKDKSESRDESQDNSKEDTMHPFRSGNRVNSSKESRLLSKKTLWPDYPEEPSTGSHFNALKKQWSPLLSARAVAAFFPSSGIKKQDDAAKGCAVLSSAVQLESEGGSESLIIEQLDLVFKWIVIGLCSKEKTVGLQSLVSAMLKLFEFLRDEHYDMLEKEATILIPHLFEKTSVAKGRFMEQFNDLVGIIRSGGMLQPNRLGPGICVYMIERTKQAKSRLLAYKECRACVEAIGLSGIGKKGLLLTAKALSEESLPENRSAALDLMVSVLIKMDGDIKRLARTCGTSHLSDKAKEMVEERWRKLHGSGGQPLSISTADSSGVSARRRSQIPLSKKVTAVAQSPVKNSSKAFAHSPSRKQRDLEGELPSLQLRIGSSSSTSPTTKSISTIDTSPNGPFRFSFDSSKQAKPASLPVSQPGADVHELQYSKDVIQRLSQVRSSSVTISSQEESLPNSGLDSPPASPMSSASRRTSSMETKPAANSTSSKAPLGAAASLRARLLKIREKHRSGEGDDSSAYTEDTRTGAAKATLTPEIRLGNAEKSKETAIHNVTPISAQSNHDVYPSAISCMKGLIIKETPIAENDPDLVECTTAVKMFHAALSKQSGSFTDLNQSELSTLRAVISENTTETIEQLAGTLHFACNCEDPGRNAGMSISLLSVTLAALMALFRDDTLASTVTQEPLILLIRGTGKALLDPRLAISNSSATSLDEATSSQMVRAINKLAVQAATGSTRHISLQALMTLQLQLCLHKADGIDAAFNNRLSRIVTKLFGRVIKAEEGGADPFFNSNVDVEALLCSIEDLLVACDDAENKPDTNSDRSLSECKNMGKSLLSALLKSKKNSGGIAALRNLIEALGINPQESMLGSVLSSFEAPTITKIDADGFPSQPTEAPIRLTEKKSDTDMVANLVTAVGSAPEGDERNDALNALRNYRTTYGDEELNQHLKEVSTTFRTYLLSQLAQESSKKNEEERNSAPSGQATDPSLSMSQRLQLLRTKIDSNSEHTMRSMYGSSMGTSSGAHNPTKLPFRSEQHSMRSMYGASTGRASKIPSPTKSAHQELTSDTVASGGSLSIGGNETGSQRRNSKMPKPSVSSLRQRLFAAQENRNKTDDISIGSSSSRRSAMGSAAALRARLEAVKKGKQHP